MVAYFWNQSQSFVNICPPDAVQGECIVVMEQLPAKPRRTGAPHQVLINIDETSVKLVPQEREGHVSTRANRLFVHGRSMGRNASLSVFRSTITCGCHA